jgi:hypothetical protein
MKKLFLSGLFIIAIAIVKGQYNTVVLLYTTQQFEKAKIEVDKLLADPKAAGKAETYLWKLNVYSEIFADKNLSPKYPDALKQAIDGLDKYVSMEPSLKLLKEYGLRPVSLLYTETFKNGRDYFEKKEWLNSFNSFSVCQNMSEFFGKNNLASNGKYTIDTTTVLYTAYAAQNAGKPGEAATRYKALANWNIGGQDYEDIYKYILDYDTKQKDETSFKKYLTVAKKLYPADMAMWNLFETNYKFASISLIDQMNHYKTEDAAGKMGENNYIDYAQSFAAADANQLSNLTAEQKKDLKLLAADAFGKAHAKKSNGLYAFNAGVLYYSLFGELSDSYYSLKGVTPDILKQKAGIIKQEDEMAIKSINWLEKGYTILKAKAMRDKSESNSLNSSVDYLADLYEWKRDRSIATNQSDSNSFDEKFKLYTSEHNKYKVGN